MDNNLDYSGARIGKYYLIKKLGKGNFGAVYRAKDMVLETEKAVKILTINNPQEVQNAFNEAAIPYKCKHKNIVTINSADLIGYNDEVLFLIDMQYVLGGSLEDLLKKKFISVINGIDIISNVLYGLEHAHINKILHSDLKPANILLDKETPLISDFGLANIINATNPEKWYITHAAPECFKKGSIITQMTDIYAIGLTMFRLVNSIKDWDLYLSKIENVGQSISRGKLFDKLAFEPYIPERVRRIIKNACLTRKYNSAAQMRNDLQKLKYNFDWKKVSNNQWRAEERNGVRRDLLLNKKGNNIEFIVKKNNRRLTDESRIFKSYEDATKHMNEYVKKTTFL